MDFRLFFSISLRKVCKKWPNIAKKQLNINSLSSVDFLKLMSNLNLSQHKVSAANYKNAHLRDCFNPVELKESKDIVDKY